MKALAVLALLACAHPQFIAAPLPIAPCQTDPKSETCAAVLYVNETDYFEPNWQRAFWGENYAKLLAIKRKYDPDGMFRCHHCVGSDEQ